MWKLEEKSNYMSSITILLSYIQDIKQICNENMLLYISTSKQSWGWQLGRSVKWKFCLWASGTSRFVAQGPVDQNKQTNKKSLIQLARQPIS